MLHCQGLSAFGDNHWMVKFQIINPLPGRRPHVQARQAKIRKAKLHSSGSAHVALPRYFSLWNSPLEDVVPDDYPIAQPDVHTL
jgi:hypothetical protein